MSRLKANRIFSLWLVRYMQVNDLTTREIARRLKASETRVYEYRSGVKVPQKKHFPDLSRALDVPQEFLERLVAVG